MALQKNIQGIIRRGEAYYVGECIDIAVVTQGKTASEAKKNLQDAVALHLDGESLIEMGFAPNPVLEFIYE